MVRPGTFSASPRDIPDAKWTLGRQRRDVLARLAAMPQVRRVAAEEAAAELEVSSRYVYKLLDRYRSGEDTVTAFMPRPGDGGRGGLRLHPAVEEIIAEMIKKRHMSRQKLTAKALHTLIADECTQRGLPVPGLNTVRRRIKQISPLLAAKRRGGDSAARRLAPAGYASPPVPGPLQRVEMDHTVVDLIIVDQVDREEIGRPYVTIAVDKGTRCVVGMVLSLEPPSRLSVALCLTHTAVDKRDYLEKLGADAEWPMAGKPVELFLDNAAEFHSADLARGCEQHAIALGFRRPWKPEDGGTVERLIGTLMRRVHEISGTTFSNTTERGEYPSQKFAVMTLPELERWLVLVIAEYHGTVHKSLGRTPTDEWFRACAKYGQPPKVTDPTSYMLDFLPSERRTITRRGFAWDGIHYYSPALNPWIERRGELGKFIVVRDPRDVSQIWVEIPAHEGYMMVPSQSLTQQPISVWELKAMKARQTAEGRSGENADALLKMRIERLDIQAAAAKLTRVTRRDAERLRNRPRPVDPLEPAMPPSDEPIESSRAGFEEVEVW